jgi:RNA polymerase sigma-70 factor (ECF subfamily)
VFDRKRSQFEALVRAYSSELYRFAYWLCRDRFTAEDLVQETYARAWTSLSMLRDEHAVKGWLYTILRREHARLFERKRLPLADDLDLDSLVDERLGSVADALEMRQALHALPVSYREPLLLQVMGGFTCEEIAEMMQVSVGAVMTRLSRARLALRRQALGDDSREASA